MYKRQKGLLPTITNIVSVILFLLIGFISVEIFTMAISGGFNILQAMAMVLLATVVFIIPLSVLVNVFPDIHLADEGIRFRVNFGLFGGSLLWSEVEKFRLLERPKFLRGNYVLIINREGYKLPFQFKGLFFESIIGRRLGIYSPVVLVTAKTLTSEEIAKIKSKTNNRSSSP